MMDACSAASAGAPVASRVRLNTWQSIRTEVLGRIRSGEWPAGSLIPTEHELAQEMGCARATVNRALRDLAESGIIQRRRKVGTRVAARPARRTRLDMPSIRDEIEGRGAEYGYRLAEAVLELPTEQAAAALRLESPRNVLLVRSLYLSDGVPWCCEMVWMNLQALPAIDRREFEHRSPHDWLAEAVPASDAAFAILSETASAATARHLSLPAASPVLVIERTSLDEDSPVAFARQFYPPRHRLNMRD